MKRVKILLLSVFVLCLVLSACSREVPYRLSKGYAEASPVTLLVLPVEGRRGSAEVKGLLRDTVTERLLNMGYRIVNPERVNDAYLRISPERLEKLSPDEMCELFDADAVLYTKMTVWRERLFLNYASLKIGAAFKLYSKGGTRLWKAKYKTKESDLRFDKEFMKLSVIEAYEPRVHRVVDAVFSTLPVRVARKEEGKKFFDWLP
ncbi:MAG: GNA1162 family protein [Thermodesulfobacteriota bacterium]